MTETTEQQPVALDALVKGGIYALYSRRDPDGNMVVIWRISSVGPKWITFCEWRGDRWSPLYRLLRSGWERGDLFVPVENPSRAG